MGWFITALVILAVGLAAAIVRRALKRGPGERVEDLFRTKRRLATIVAIAAFVIGGFILLMDSFTIVPARNVGVVNVLGNANETLSNGFHWVRPWASVEKIDATVQNLNLAQDKQNCITVRLANQTTACVDVQVQWQVDQHANANELWQRYRGNNDNVVANIGTNVVERELRRSLNIVFESYNPLAALTSNGAPLVQVKTDDLAAKALTEMQANLDSGIVVDKLRISLVHFDDVTQQKLNGYAQALADTQIATQQKLTAQQQKEANDLLAAASSNDAGVKYQNCLNLLKDLAAKNQLASLPPTFNCGPSDTPVIISAK